MKPIYKHDCDDCIFLGNSKDGTKDLYYHAVGHETVIARFGSNGDYMSGMVFVGKNPYLTEAYKIAKERNLIYHRILKMKTIDDKFTKDGNVIELVEIILTDNSVVYDILIRDDYDIIFKTSAYDKKDAQKRFNHLVEALKY